MADFTEIATRSEEFDLQQKEAASIVNGVSSEVGMYCSFSAEGPDDRKRLFNALSTDGLPLAENTGKELCLCDVAIQPVNLENADGSSSVCPRISLFTANGDVYSATSWGLYKALQRIYALYGTLHFDTDNPLVIEAVRVKTKKGNTFNLKIM